VNRKPVPESDICDKFIRPDMEAAGWNGMDPIYREFPLRAGRVVARGQKPFRDKTTMVRADYALLHKPDIAQAVVEAKDNSHAMGAGMASR
jgi:type I restriction enzyme, R subunit